MKKSSARKRIKKKKKKKTSAAQKQIQHLLKHVKGKERELTDNDFVSTGSTVLNCAISGKPDRGFAKGRYYFLVGDSASGKTFLTLTSLAEAAINPNFDKHRFIYDGVEGGAMMDIEKFFGSKVWNRLETPNIIGKNNRPGTSVTIEDFYHNFDDALKDGRPFIYILDSMDALTSKYEQAKFQAAKKARTTNEEVAGSFGDGKAKKNAEGVRQILDPIAASDSILIVISQTRDNIGFGFKKKTRSGGHALKFYATVEIWSSRYGRITKVVKGKKRAIGIKVQLEVEKNRVTGWEGRICSSILIHKDTGIDDVGSCVDYLIAEGHWTKSCKAKKIDIEKKTGIIDARDIGIEPCSREKIIKHIEEQGKEQVLAAIVGDIWNEIEEASKSGRKNKYE